MKTENMVAGFIGLAFASTIGYAIYKSMNKSVASAADGDPGNGDNSNSKYNRWSNAAGDPGNGDNSTSKYNAWGETKGSWNNATGSRMGSGKISHMASGPKMANSRVSDFTPSGKIKFRNMKEWNDFWGKGILPPK